MMLRQAQHEGAKRIQIRPYRPEDLELLEVQAVQGAERLAAEAGALEGRWSRTVLHHGALVACAGIAPVWPGRAFAWAFTGTAFPRAGWLGWTRYVRATLDDCQAAGYRRIETTVAADFAMGTVWAGLLGFRVEGLMQAWLGSRDYLLYARIRP